MSDELPSPEIGGRAQKVKPKFPRIDMKEVVRIKKLIENSKNHDRHTCDCEGCKYWWTIPVRMGAAGFLYEISPASEKKHTQLSFHYDHKMMLNIVIEGKVPPFHLVWYSENQFMMRFA